MVTERWGKLLGQAVVVDNQSGGGVVASLATARAASDGCPGGLDVAVATRALLPCGDAVAPDGAGDASEVYRELAEGHG